MVNWPYVYAAAKGDAERSHRPAVVDDIGWARYPGVKAGEASRPPLGGINLAIGAFTKYPEQALDLVKCATSLQSNIEYMVDSGNPAAKAGRLRRPEGPRGLPDGRADPRLDQRGRAAADHALLQRRLDVGADHSGTRRRTVQAPQTPEETATFMTDVLQGKRLL